MPSLPGRRRNPACYRVYPGEGETNAAELARELVGLSKLNFNNTQFDTGDPITVRAARRVGDILKHVPDGKKVNSRLLNRRCATRSGRASERSQPTLDEQIDLPTDKVWSQSLSFGEKLISAGRARNAGGPPACSRS